MNTTPHGPGFSFLDGFAVTEAGKRGHGRKTLDPGLPFFADHFPGDPLMPGVLLIECAAQAAGALWASLQTAGAPAHFVLAQVLQFKLLHPVLPAQTVETEVTLDQILGPLAQFSVILTVDDGEVARGRLVLSQPVA